MSGMAKIGDDAFDAEVVKSDHLTLVEFGATWCEPCKKLHPILEDLAGEYQGRVKIVEVNVEESPATATKFGVFNVPRLLFFKNGVVKETVVGLLARSKIEDKIEKHLG